MTEVIGGPGHVPGRPPTSFSKTGARAETTGGAATKSKAVTPCTILLAAGRQGCLPRPRGRSQTVQGGVSADLVNVFTNNSFTAQKVQRLESEARSVERKNGRHSEIR